MPFTPAHPAIVLPFVKKHYFSASGLIIGSLAPDVEYFLTMSVYGHHGHTAWGLLYFDVPVSFLLAFIFHGIVKQELIINLPVFLQQRLQGLLYFDFPKYLRKHAFIFFISVLLGALSHIFWDAFTHRNGFFVQLLSYQSLYILNSKITLYNFFQHLSTLLGLTAIGIYIHAMKIESMTSKNKPSWAYWSTIAAVTMSVVCLRFFIRSIDLILGNFVVTCITGFCIGLIIAGLQKRKIYKIGK